MRARRTLAAAIALASSLAGAGACISSAASDPIVPCTESALPTDGARCDPSELGPFGYCRLSTCAWLCENECSCGADGRWKCGTSCRDGAGCGTAPKCRDECASGGDAGVCPSTEPKDGTACTNKGVTCSQYGSIGCPEAASCQADGTWRITCPAFAFGTSTPCTCAHPLPANDAGVDGAESGVCALVGGACPMGCVAIEAMPYDATRACFGASQTVGCAHGIDGGTVTTCGKDAGGKLWRFPSNQLPEGSGFVACDTSESAAVTGAHPACM